MTDKLMWTPKEAAEALGISRSKMYELLAAGKLPAVKIGSSVRVPVDGLKAWIEQHVGGGR